MKSQDIYSALPEIGTIAKGSAAEKAGLKPGDVDRRNRRQAGGPHGPGPARPRRQVRRRQDHPQIQTRRRTSIEIKALELVGKNAVVAQAVPRHPADARRSRSSASKSATSSRIAPPTRSASKPGDRIVKYGLDEKALIPFTGEKRGRTQFLEWLNTQTPGTRDQARSQAQEGRQDRNADRDAHRSARLGPRHHAGDPAQTAGSRFDQESARAARDQQSERQAGARSIEPRRRPTPA